jgi:hypothetical protein
MLHPGQISVNDFSEARLIRPPAEKINLLTRAPRII